MPAARQEVTDTLGLAREMFARRAEYRDRLADTSNEVLADVARDLGGLLVRLADDHRLDELLKPTAASGDDMRALQRELDRLAAIDWSVFLIPAGYRSPPPVHRYAADFANVVTSAIGGRVSGGADTLRIYLRDLGARLNDDAVAGLERSTTWRRRTSRRVGRALWSIGRIGAAAAVGAGILLALPAVGPVVPALAGGAAIVSGSALSRLAEVVLPKLGEAAVESILPEEPWGDHTENADLRARAARFDAVLRTGEFGRLRATWEILAEEQSLVAATTSEGSSDEVAVRLAAGLSETAATTVLRCTEIVGAAIAVFDLAFPVWSIVGESRLVELQSAVDAVTEAVVSDPPDPSRAAEELGRLIVAVEDVRRLLERHVLTVHQKGR